MLTCSRCGESKDDGEFPPRPEMRSGRSSWCRPCHRQAVRDARAKYGDEYNRRRRKATAS